MESYGTAYKTAYGTSMNLRLRLLAECDVCVAPLPCYCRVCASVSCVLATAACKCIPSLFPL